MAGTTVPVPSCNEETPAFYEWHNFFFKKVIVSSVYNKAYHATNSVPHRQMATELLPSGTVKEHEWINQWYEWDQSGMHSYSILALQRVLIRWKVGSCGCLIHTAVGNSFHKTWVWCGLWVCRGVEFSIQYKTWRTENLSTANVCSFFCPQSTWQNCHLLCECSAKQSSSFCETILI